MYPSIGKENGSYSRVPSLKRQAHTLARKGYNAAEAQTLADISSPEIKKRYLQQNLETTINHVFEDSVVSFTNYYQMNDKGEVISYPDGTILHIDPDERGGLNEFGIKSAVAGALENPEQVVLLYSPPGPVVFDNNPHNKFKEVKPYVDGQLYMMYSDGKKVNNVAICISDEGESWISHIMPYEYKNAATRNSPIEKVKYFITHPFLTGKSIDAFLDDQWNFQERVIFNNKDNIKFSLSETLARIRQSLAGQLSKSPIVNQVLQCVDVEHITTYDIDLIYSDLAQQYMRGKGINTLILGGSCGGTEIKLDPFSNELNNLSTSFRMVVQGKNPLKMSKDHRDDPHLCRCSAASGPHFHCPGIDKKTKEPCNHAVVVGEGTVACPMCGKGKTC